MAKVAIFDLVGTLFSLRAIGELLERETGCAVADFWFQEVLQTSMSATLAERYLPFRDVVEVALTNLLEVRGVATVSVPEVLESFRELPPDEGAVECLKRLAEEGLRTAVLTNSARNHALALLQRFGLAAYVEMVISADEVERCKPHTATYRLALDRLDTEPENCWMVSAHGWDLYGAAAVGLHSVWVMRRDRRWPFPGYPPGGTVSSLAEVPDLILRGARAA